jgi:hypothetical protein
MIVLAPLLLILLANHVHANQRGELERHDGMRSRRRQRHLKAGATTPTQAPDTGKKGMDKASSKAMEKTPSNVFKMDSKVKDKDKDTATDTDKDKAKDKVKAKSGKGKGKGSSSNIFEKGPAKTNTVPAAKEVRAEAKAKGTMGRLSKASSKATSSPNVGNGASMTKGEYAEKNSKSGAYIEKKSRASTKGMNMSIHKIGFEAYDTDKDGVDHSVEIAATDFPDSGDESSTVQPEVNSQSEVFEDWSMTLGLPEVTAALSSIALPITVRQVGIDCTLDPDTEFFGEATNDLVIIPYLYQITMVRGTPLAIINRRITPALDFGFAQGILPYFFPCAGTRRLQQTSGITGISALGLDTPLVGGRKYIHVVRERSALFPSYSRQKLISSFLLVS